MPSWMPGEDYYTDFHKGDPYVKVDQGFARLPGAGYAALHPELEDVNPEDYPDIHQMAILADVAPYSREYNTFRLKVGNQARDNTELQIEYEKILERVRQTKESVIRMQDQVSPSCPTTKLSRGRGRSSASLTVLVVQAVCLLGLRFEGYLSYGDPELRPFSFVHSPSCLAVKPRACASQAPALGRLLFCWGARTCLPVVIPLQKHISFGGAIVLGIFVRESRGNMGFPKMS